MNVVNGRKHSSAFSGKCLLHFSDTLKRALCLLLCLLLPLCALAEYAAPIGDAGLRYEAIVPMYLPSHDGQRLLAFYETLDLSLEQHPAEAILRALLSHPGNARVRALGGGVTLSLAGSDPVEVSGSVCTVNLSASSLQLAQADLYTTALAITATLCELDDITHVNLLVAGTPIAMDVSGTLPLGTLTAPAGQELPVLWEQMAARRAPVGTAPEDTPLTATATLYIPLGSGGIVATPRRLSFPGQSPAQLVDRLLSALSAATSVPGGCELPDLSALMLSAPTVSGLNSGGQRVTLHFRDGIENALESSGCDAASAFASVVYTITTFVPSVQQVYILVGEGALTSLYSSALGSMLFPGGLHARIDYTHALMAQRTIVLPADGTLTSATVAVPYRSAASPRAWLLHLGRTVLPQGLTDADVLGLSVTGDTLHIHLSSRYADVIRASDQDQRLMAYAMVNTLCGMLDTRRVQFTFGGESLADLGQDTCWDGTFIYNPGLVAP